MLRGRDRKQLDALQRAELAALAASETKALDVLVLKVSDLTLVTDYLVICSGPTSIRVRAIADHVRRRMAEAGSKPLGVEGYDEGLWVLLDYGDIIVHVFREDERKYYALERLWGDGERIRIEALDTAQV